MKLLRFMRESLKYSPLRCFEYEELVKNSLHGKVLDLGGGVKASYAALFKGSYETVSINIEPSMKPTIVGDITKPFPLKDEEFDAAISFNTFEHIFDYETPFKETFRVLKSGGRFIFSIPFLHQIHGSPNDYWRYSGSALEELLKKHGFKVGKVIPLGTGMFAARYSLMYGAIPWPLKPIWACGAYLADTILMRLARYRKFCGPHNYPLGYFVYAEKP